MALLNFGEGLDSLGSLLALQNDLERFMRNPAFAMGPSGYGAYPPVNIFDSPEGALVVAEVPGLDPSKMNISGQGHTLTISGERRFEHEGAGWGYHRRELSEGQFSRSIRLPEEFEANRAQARYEAGLLMVKIPRAEHAKAQKISIESA
jgi:HSP20 family protein